MKKTVFLLSMMILLLSSCITLEEIPTSTPILMESPQATQVQPSNTIQFTATEQIPATETIKPAASQTIVPTLTLLKTVPPTVTLTVTKTPTPIFTPTKTHTLTPTLTPTKTATPTKTPTLTPYPYILQNGAPVYLANFGYPDAGCNWMGIGGQIFDKNGNPIINLVVWVRGTIQNQPFEKIVLTGTADGNKYGPGGYEAVLSNLPVVSSNIFSIQILDLNGNLLSDRVFFDTSSKCTENLIVLNFNTR